MPRLITAVAATVAFLVAFPAASDDSARPRKLTFEERVVAQQAIEEVYWRHRIWPAENAGPKPVLESVLPLGAIRARVADDLRKSRALEDLWGMPITATQLQAELDRMARHTQGPELLKQLHDALGGDAFLVAECLARPILANRLIRSWHGKGSADRGEFDAWWEKERAKFGADLVAPDGNYRLPETAANCTDDTWTSTFTDAPTPRFLHSAVWTGAEMIVWGGQWILDSGGRYDPATDTWTATSRIGAPSPRFSHTAIWTGTTMVVWGGQDGESSFLGTGGRYDPSTDRWAPTSTGPGVPTPRSLDSEDLDFGRQVFQAAKWTSSRSLPMACSSWVRGMAERFPFGWSRLKEKLGRRTRA